MGAAAAAPAAASGAGAGFLSTPLGKFAATAGLGALSGALSGSDQTLESFRDTGPLSDPVTLTQEGVRGTARLGQALTELAEQPVELGPQTIVQSPPFFFGGDLPFPVGVTGRDPGFKPIPRKILNDPFQSLGGFDTQTPDRPEGFPIIPDSETPDRRGGDPPGRRGDRPPFTPRGSQLAGLQLGTGQADGGLETNPAANLATANSDIQEFAQLIRMLGAQRRA